MALSLTKPSADKISFTIYTGKDEVVHIFTIKNEYAFNKIINKIGLPVNWKWTEASALLGTVSINGTVQVWEILVRLFEYFKFKCNDKRRRPLISIEVNYPNTTWADFSLNRKAEPFLLIKNKDNSLGIAKLSKNESALTVKPIQQLQNDFSFCKLDTYNNEIIYPNGSDGIAKIRFTYFGFVIDSDEDFAFTSQIMLMFPRDFHVSNVMKKQDDKFGMMCILKVIGEWLVIVYESGMVFLHDIPSNKCIAEYDLTLNYKGLEEDHPLPMACEGCSQMRQFVVAVGFAFPKLFLAEVSFPNGPKEKGTIFISTTIDIDGCGGLSMNSSEIDLIAVNGLSGDVNLFTFPEFEHALKIPHTEKTINNIKLLTKPGQRDRDEVQLYLVCVSGPKLTFWDINHLQKLKNEKKSDLLNNKLC